MKVCFSSLLLPVLLLAGPSDRVSDFWFSGAEINRYALEQSRYGSQHPGHAVFIYVTEPFLLEEQVKREYGDGAATDVLKLNALRTFNTGLYAYRTMTSTFYPVDPDRHPHALKSNTSVQDWCGQVFQQLNKTDAGWRGQAFSYFQKAGDRRFTLPDKPLEDALWVLLRLDPTRLPRGDVELIPGALFSRFSQRPAAPAEAVAEIDAGPETSRYRIEYPELKRTLEIHFDTTFPHIIRSWRETTPDGVTSAQLEDRIMHSDYWNKNRPEHRSLRGQLGLDPVPD